MSRSVVASIVPNESIVWGMSSAVRRSLMVAARLPQLPQKIRMVIV
jgi:hypothetical protein